MRSIKFRIWDKKKKKMYTLQKIKRDGLQLSWYNGNWALNELFIGSIKRVVDWER